MRDSQLDFFGLWSMLFTRQRGWRWSWYAGRLLLVGLSTLWLSFMSHAQSVEEVFRDGVICRVVLEWDSDDMLELLDRSTGELVEEWHTAIGEGWNGVQVLDVKEVWMPLEPIETEALQRQWRPKKGQPWTWSVLSNAANGRLMGRGALVAHKEGQWQKLVRMETILGASPVATNRTSRNWPLQSVLAEGTWHSLATVEEGVHCIGYDELVGLGLSPAEVNPAELRLFGWGGGSLPLQNGTERPLDIPQQRVATRGLDDGSFDPGDELCWHAPEHERWSWHEEDGWTHQPSFWGDTAKWFLRTDAPSDLARAEMEVAAAWNGLVDEVRTTHLLRGVEEEHEVNLIRSGRNWFGKRLTALGSTTASWNIPVAEAVIGDSATLRFAVAMRTMGSGSTSQVRIESSGTSESFYDQILTPNTLLYARYFSREMRVSVLQEGVQALLTFEPGTDDSNAWVDYMTYQLQQHLVAGVGQLAINGLPVNGSGVAVSSAEYQVSGAMPDEIWDVTDRMETKRIPWGVENDKAVWRQATSDYPQRFVAFRWSSAKRPIPLGNVPNSNVHGLGEVDYVIVSVPSLMEAADSLANLHAARGLRVAVVPQRDVFDALSSGVADPTAIKMLMMMLQDRSDQSMGALDAPRYLLMMGDASYENRNLDPNGDILVGFYSEESLSTTNSYISDDYFTLVAEGQGESVSDLLQFGVGRIPTSSLTEAMAVVGKVAVYTGDEEEETDLTSCVDPNGTSIFGPWRNRILFVSDDQDGNNDDGHRYMETSEEFSNLMRANHPEYDVVKVYPDAYVQTNTPGGERYVDAAAEIARRVDEGALIVNYIGHGGERGWAHERILNMETIEGWTNLRRMPLFMTATCELFRHDDPDVYSAGEAILFNPRGGGVAMLTTTRTVYSSGNAQVNRAFFDIVFDESQSRRLGDIYTDTKNSDVITADLNARNFSLMGDPALELARPRERVFFTEIPDTVRSLDEVLVRGYVGNVLGDTLTSFNGVVVPTVFDKLATVSTLDNDQDEGPFTYEVFQNILHKGLATVTNGTFEFRFIVPRDLNYAYGQGRISGYALSAETDAHGQTENFVIGGTSDNPISDDAGPQISLYMNDTLFKDGDTVHEDPWLFARIFDDSGINTSGNGIGHDAKAVLDGDTGNPFVLNEYFVSDLDTYKRGSIRFPFQNLSDGRHDLELKVWDVANNSAFAVTHFVVASSIEVALEEVLAYPNPSVDQVTFRMTGNQACKQAQVKLEVFSVEGRKVHEQDFEGEVLGFRDDVMTWDLNQISGGRVPHGVYVFRVTWKNEFDESAQYADQLVVLRPQ